VSGGSSWNWSSQSSVVIRLDGVGHATNDVLCHAEKVVNGSDPHTPESLAQWRINSKSENVIQNVLQGLFALDIAERHFEIEN
jgi:hypothetical protein